MCRLHMIWSRFDVRRHDARVVVRLRRVSVCVREHRDCTETALLSVTQSACHRLLNKMADVLHGCVNVTVC